MRGRLGMAGWVMAAALGVAGCLGGGRSPAVRFFQLQPAEGLVPVAGAALDPRVGVLVRPVALEGYLNRPQVVDRVGPYEVGYREYERWAEPLDRNVTRVVGENLRRLLGADRVVLFPGVPAGEATVTLQVEISRLEAKPGGRAVLQAGWSVRLDPGGARRSRTRTFEAAVAGDGVEDGAAAQAGLLAELCKAMAEDVVAVSAAGGPVLLRDR